MAVHAGGMGRRQQGLELMDGGAVGFGEFGLECLLPLCGRDLFEGGEVVCQLAALWPALLPLEAVVEVDAADLG